MALAIVNSIDSKNANHDIELFLKNKSRGSLETEKSYRNHINEFLTFVNLGESTYIEVEELEKIKYKNVLQYVGYLENKGNVASTIDSKLAALKSLWRHFSKDYNFNPAIWEVTLDKSAQNHHPEFTSEEFKLFLDFCLEQQCKGLEKKLYFETLYITGLRKSAVSNMEWDNIQKIEDINGEMVWTIQIRDKGNKHDIVPISDDFHYRLSILSERNDSGSNKVFQINDKTLYKTIAQFKEKYKIDKKLTIHSVKSTSVTDAWTRSGGDLKRTQEQAHHNDPTLTLKKYVRNSKDLKSKLSYGMDKEINTRKLEDLSKEELLNLIDRSSDKIKKELLGLM